jgi:hypothetical protein
MQEAISSADSNNQIRLSQGIHDCLHNFRWMSDNIQNRPTQLYELVPQAKPDLLGTCNTSGQGLGGIWFPAANQIRPWKSTHDCDGTALHSTEVVPLQSGTALASIV